MEENEFSQALKDQGLPIDEVKLEQFERYYEWLVDWNEKVNLTAITDKEEVYLKHFYDSLTLAEFEGLAEVETLVDVGAGAGFPSLPVKILYPELKVTIVDSLKKRINFLEILADELGLRDVHFVHGRAEDFGQDPKYRESFDLATARAVARLSVLAEFCLPLVKKGGHFVALKGSYEQTAEEVEKGQKALKTLGGKYIQTLELELPQGAGERSLVVTEKTKETPNKYPRKAGTPNKKPLE